MIIFASKDLDKYGISHQSSSQLMFKGRMFTKGQTFAAHLRNIAIELAEENLTLGQPCIVIDYDSHVTLWRVQRSPVVPTTRLPQKQGTASKDKKHDTRQVARQALIKRGLWDQVSRPMRTR